MNRNQRFLPRSSTMAIVMMLFTLSPLMLRANAQDQQDQDDPPGRVARLGYMEGSVSFEPAGETEWVQAVPNRPMTTDDRLWADKDSRAEVALGSATIRLAANTGFSFLNLDDRTVQIDLSAGILDIQVRRLGRDDIFEVDTPNQALTAFQPGDYRIEASEDGTYTVVTVRNGDAESTGNGQKYEIHAGQRMTLSGTTSLSAEVQQVGNPDDFDNWSYSRERRYQNPRSAQYCSPDVVGLEDLDDYGDWRPYPSYGNVWFPRVAAGWAPYHEGHWAWIDPWGWTWVDDDPWGYAPFHYGRWASIDGRWGWIPGPREVRPVYAPALVAFVGYGTGPDGNVGWFPLGPREVYVPSYRVSPGYVNRVNVTNTTVNTTTVTNVYNTTIINKTTTISNVNYVNRNVQGAVIAVPQRAFASAQPVAHSAVSVDNRQIAAAPSMARAAVLPTRQAVLGLHASTANRVAAPPASVANRTVIAKATPPQAPPSFATREPALQAHPGEPLARPEMQKLRTAGAAGSVPVKQAPPAKAATPVQAANQPNARPGAAPATSPAPANRPEPNRPATAPERNDRPNAAPPSNRPNEGAPENRQPESSRSEPNRPTTAPERNDRPNAAPPNNRPNEAAPENRQPEPNRPATAPERNDRPNAAPPSNRPNEAAPENRQPEPNRSEPNRPTTAPERNDRPSAAPPNNRPNETAPDNRQAEPNRPEPNRPVAAPDRNDRPPSAEQGSRPDGNRAPQTPDERKRQEDPNKPQTEPPQ